MRKNKTAKTCSSDACGEAEEAERERESGD